MNNTEKFILSLIVESRKEVNKELRKSEDNSTEQQELLFLSNNLKLALTYINSREKQLKEVAKNVRHKACELIYDVNTHKPDIHGLHNKIMNIQFEDVKPK